MKEIEYYDLDWRDDVAYEFDSKSPFTGIVVNYYTETEKKLKEKFITKNGEKDGSYESYHENGQLWEEGKFKEDKKEGLHHLSNQDRNIQFLS